MEKHEILHAIATLTNSIDPLLRAEQKEVITKIAEKITELLKQL